MAHMEEPPFYSDDSDEAPTVGGQAFADWEWRGNFGRCEQPSFAASDFALPKASSKFHGSLPSAADPQVLQPGASSSNASSSSASTSQVLQQETEDWKKFWAARAQLKEQQVPVQAPVPPPSFPAAADPQVLQPGASSSNASSSKFPGAAT